MVKTFLKIMAIILVLFIYLIYKLLTGSPSQGFFEDNTKILWPEGSYQIQTHQDPSFLHANWVEAHLTIPPQKIDPFIKKNNLTAFQPDLTIEDENYHQQKNMISDLKHPLKFLNSLEEFPTQFTTISSLKNLYYLQGNHTGQHRFSMLLDNKTGSLWIQMFHPD